MGRKHASGSNMLGRLFIGSENTVQFTPTPTPTHAPVLLVFNLAYANH